MFPKANRWIQFVEIEWKSCWTFGVHSALVAAFDLFLDTFYGPVSGLNLLYDCLYRSRHGSYFMCKMARLSNFTQEHHANLYFMLLKSATYCIASYFTKWRHMIKVVFEWWIDVTAEASSISLFSFQYTACCVL